MIALWIAAAVAGLGVATFAGQRAVHHAAALTRGTRIPPFFVGITLVAIGTDLPEIANSIASSAAGHGDLNVGDSMGSTLTQVSLVLGSLPFFAGSFAVDRKQILVMGAAICACTGIATLTVGDGRLGRGEAVILLGAWAVSSWIVWHVRPTLPVERGQPTRSRARHVFFALIALACVGGGATLAILALVEIAALMSVPEYMISFFALSLGTSLPELIVDVTALRRGQRQLAVGDVFGSSLVDSSLSISIGPLLFPNVVDASLAVRGGLVALAVVSFVTVVAAMSRRIDRRRGLLMLLAYAAAYPTLIAS